MKTVSQIINYLLLLLLLFHLFIIIIVVVVVVIYIFLFNCKINYFFTTVFEVTTTPTASPQ